MRKGRLAVIVTGAAVAIGVAAACGKDNGTGPATPVDLTGSYVLDALVFSGINTYSTGSLAFTSDSFDASFHVLIPTVVDTTLDLQGAYVARHTSKGDSIYLTGDSLPATIVGTFAVNGPILDLNLTIPGLGGLNSSWHRQ